jgi:aminoglycoside phosphotransferase (APT) family kinase protein
MRDSDVERVCLEVVPGHGAVEITALGEGLVNQTHRVARDGVSYALRLREPGSLDLGQDGEWEIRVIAQASADRLAPPLVYADARRGILLSRWAQGRAWSVAEARLPGNLAKFAHLVPRIHAMPPPQPARAMHPSDWIRFYHEALERRPAGAAGAAADDGAAGSGEGRLAGALPPRSAADARLRQLASLPRATAVLCHSDLHPLNLVEAADSLQILDWEYAHVSEPLWDVAGWCANCDLGPESQLELLGCYQAEISASASDRDARARLPVLIWLYDYVCLLWCVLYLTQGADRPGSTLQSIARRADVLAARLTASSASKWSIPVSSGTLGN